MRYPHSIIGHRRTISTAMTMLVLLSSLPIAAAQTPKTSYLDVAAGAYYEDSAKALLDLGALDSREVRLRPSALATRAEVVKLMVNLRGRTLMYPASSSFNDVARSAWYFPYIEAAASAGWVHGDGNCYRSFRPCTARPVDTVNRAEAAALLVRIFALEQLDSAPQFDDNPSYEWYFQYVQTAADHCILQGDAETGLVRPAASMNRAEMVVMFHRASQHLTYGVDCGATTTNAKILSLTALSVSRVRVTFTTPVRQGTAEDTSRYTLVRQSDGATVGIRSATLVSDRVVELDVVPDINANVSYRLSVHALLTTSGLAFSDSDTFVLAAAPAHLISVSVIDARHVRAVFDTDLDAVRAEQAYRYILTRFAGTVTIPVQSAALVNNRTVDLTLGTDLVANNSFSLSVQHLQTRAGVDFSDVAGFNYTVMAGHIITVTVSTPIRLRATFDTDIDTTRAQEEERYSVTTGSRVLPILFATMITSRTVELLLGESMKPQFAYTVNARDMLTLQGVLFSASGSVVNNGGSGSGTSVSLKATLTGMQEVPPVTTPASGTGTFILAADGLHYDISVRNMTGGSTITAAHFHAGAPGVSGPVLMPISFTGNHAVGLWGSITNSQRNDLLSGQIYVNVHTATHPDGEIRGQVIVQ